MTVLTRNLTLPMAVLAFALTTPAGAIPAFAEGIDRQETDMTTHSESGPSDTQDETAHDTSHTNRLATSTSPYLLLHQHNPVDWYPWGPEALQRARDEDKPIFLSVGYSSCYWCHVMERESFSNSEIAALMNRDFINIKVDREERPDLDEIYMAATQIMTGHGGWPNSVFLTPDLKPFYTGTYFPPEDRYGRPGFPSVLKGVARAWQDQRPQVQRSAEEVSARIGAYLQSEMSAENVVTPGPEAARRSLAELAARFDAEWGGFGGAPKFPTPSNLFLLLEAGASDPSALEMLRTTLDEMARGGIYDQLAGGFHRYATDREWKIPHFEKMLYDNGLLLEIYARTYEIDPDPEWRRVVEETVGFLEREMMGPEGAFWSAIDAETDAHEGAYYVWTREEIDRALGGDDSVDLAPVLGFSGSPFFEETHYVLHLPAPLEELASRQKTTRSKLLMEIAPLRRALLAARSSRKRPLTDDKILADWNGLVIAGLANAGRVFDQPAMIERAATAANFILESMWVPDSTSRADGKQLLHAFREGQAHIPAFLSDYSYLVHGLLALHRATGDEKWLRTARELIDEQTTRLGATEGSYFVAADSDDVLFRSRDPFDGAVPSANGIALWNLLELAQRTEDEGYRSAAERSLKTFASLLERSPAAVRSLSVGAVRLAGGWPLPGAAPMPVSAPSVAAATSQGSSRPTAEAESVVESRLTLVEPGADGGRAFEVRLEIAEGWHVNANPASLDFLIPTTVAAVSADALASVDYPEGESFRFAFADQDLSVYHDAVTLRGEWKGDGPPVLELTYQPCDDQRCLPPVTRTLRIP